VIDIVGEQPLEEETEDVLLADSLRKYSSPLCL